MIEPQILILALLPLIIWDAVWKAIGMWHSARDNKLTWFICILIFNTLGILPIIYVLLVRKPTKKKK